METIPALVCVCWVQLGEIYPFVGNESGHFRYWMLNFSMAVREGVVRGGTS